MSLHSNIITGEGMTQDEIIEMAKQAGMIADGEMWFSSFYKIEQDVHISHLKAFAKLVAQHEREACAKTIESLPLFAIGNQQEYEKATIEDAAKQIRARGQA
jgi:hypothetical protein